MTDIISADMQETFLSDRRVLCWFWWIEGQTTDLYAWSGVHTISWDGQDWKGVGHVAGMESLRKTEDMEHVEQRLKLSGLDPTVIADLDTSVRGRAAKVWLGALNEAGQVIADPLLIQELQQDTLTWERAADDTVTLTLTCFEALPFVGRATGRKWSYESQLEAYALDVGFKYNAPIALTGAPIDWRLG